MRDTMPLKYSTGPKVDVFRSMGWSVKDKDPMHYWTSSDKKEYL
jgi:hypothetical protein